MKIRTNRFLKLFATLLFVLEILSPALSLEADPMVYNFDETCQCNKRTHPTILLTLFNEKLTETEEGRTTDKNVVAGMELMIQLSISNAANLVKIGLAQLNKPSSLFKLQPLLFQLYLSYLI